MKSTNQALKNLLASARSAAVLAPESTEPDSMPLGLATRIAARWTAGPPSAQIVERLAAAGFAVALVVCAGAALLKPKPVAQEPDAMLSLFYARPATPADDFPF